MKPKLAWRFVLSVVFVLAYLFGMRVYDARKPKIDEVAAALGQLQDMPVVHVSVSYIPTLIQFGLIAALFLIWFTYLILYVRYKRSAFTGYNL